MALCVFFFFFENWAPGGQKEPKLGPKYCLGTNFVPGLQCRPPGPKTKKMHAEKPCRTPPPEFQMVPYGASYGQKPFGAGHANSGTRYVLRGTLYVLRGTLYVLRGTLYVLRGIGYSVAWPCQSVAWPCYSVAWPWQSVASPCRPSIWNLDQALYLALLVIPRPGPLFSSPSFPYGTLTMGPSPWDPTPGPLGPM